MTIESSQGTTLTGAQLNGESVQATLGGNLGLSVSKARTTMVRNKPAHVLLVVLAMLAAVFSMLMSVKARCTATIISSGG
ncbi:MAG TPA: hypothetical protein ACHBX0_14550 [Arsenophonus sp.]